MSRGQAAPELAQLTRSSLIAMAGGLSSQGLKFLVIIYIGRTFRIADFGSLSFAIAVNAYLFTISSFGLPFFASRAVAKSGEVPRTLLGEVFLLRASLTLLGTTLCVGILQVIPTVSRAEMFLVAVFGLSNLPLAGLFDWVFQGLHRQEISAALNVIYQGFWLLLTVAGVKLGMGTLAVPLALCASALASSVSGYLYLQRKDLVDRHGCLPHLLQRSCHTLRSAAPLGWGVFFITALVWSDAIAVRLLLGEYAVGIYAAGNRAALAMAMLAGFYIQGAFPMLTWASNQGRQEFSHFFEQSLLDISLVFVPGSIWLFFYAPKVILLLFTRLEFLAAVPVFRIFQVVFLLTVANALIGIGILVSHHRDREYVKIQALTVLAFVPLCIALTIHFALIGAAMAVLLAQVLACVLFLIEGHPLMPTTALRFLVAPVAAGLAVVLVCSVLHLSLIVGIGPLVVAYLLLFIWRERQRYPFRPSIWPAHS